MSTNIEVLSAVHGIAPRSDELHRLGTSVEKGRASWEEYTALRAQETAHWLAVQADAGIDIQEDGKLAWQDHLRPLVKASEGFAPGVDDAPVTRWFDTNRFYRRPTITDRLQFDSGRFSELYGEPGVHISLLAPDTFAALCDTVYDGLPIERHVKQWYEEIILGLGRLGVQRITLESYCTTPLPGTNPGRETRAIKDVRQFAGLEPGISFALLDHARRPRLHSIPSGNIGLTADAAGLSEDLVRYDRDGLQREDLAGAELWLKVVEADTTATDLTPQLAEHLRVIAPGRAVLTHTTDLEQVPLPYAVSKLHQLGEAVENLKQQLEERS